MMKHRSLAVLVVFLAFLAVSGCAAKGRRNTGTIMGKVLYQGQPLPGGTIHFFQGDAAPFSFMIRGDGSFVAEVPIGPAQVAIETETAKYKGTREEMIKKWKEHAGPEFVHLKQPKTGEPPSSAPRMVYKEIPARFSDPDESGLTHEVVPGEQHRDFELK